MYMHITPVVGEKIVEFCYDGDYRVTDVLLSVVTNQYPQKVVHYPLVNVLRFELKNTKE